MVEICQFRYHGFDFTRLPRWWWVDLGLIWVGTSSIPWAKIGKSLISCSVRDKTVAFIERLLRHFSAYALNLGVTQSNSIFFLQWWKPFLKNLLDNASQSRKSHLKWTLKLVQKWDYFGGVFSPLWCINFFCNCLQKIYISLDNLHKCWECVPIGNSKFDFQSH